jgi:hypothetical protein
MISLELTRLDVLDTITPKQSASIIDIEGVPFLALPAELRAMVYCHLLPTVAESQVYLGLRVSCSTMQREFDHEALHTLRCQYQHAIAANPDLPLTIDIPTCFKDVRTLRLRIKPLTPKIYGGLLSYQLVPWVFRWLRDVVITYEPTGVQENDDLVFNTICVGIKVTINRDHPYKTHRQRVKVGKVDDISMLKRIIFKCDGDDKIERPVPDTGGLVDCYRRRDCVTFKESRVDTNLHEPMGCEWQRSNVG